MGSHKHAVEALVSYKTEWGDLRYLLPNYNNRSVVFCMDRVNTDTGEVIENGDSNLIFEDKIVDSIRMDELHIFSLSFDGKKLATAKRLESDPWYYGISINGKPFWTSEAGFDIYRLAWLSNDTLAWYGWFRVEANRSGSDRGIKYFVNGKDQTGRFVFEEVIGERGQRVILCKEENHRYDIHDDHTYHNDGLACCDKLTSCFCHLGEPRPEVSMPKEERDTKAGQVRVSFNGQTGEWFDNLENQSGMRTYSFNEDRSRFGYIGLRYTGISRKLGRWIGKLFSGSPAEEARANRKLAWWMWPLALVYNPYFGPLYAAEEDLKRYFPVNNGQVWKKGWEFATDHFFTPKNELVVTVRTGAKWQVVIDEKAGPSFDDVYNVRYLKDEACICYLARRGLEIMRVTVR